MAARPHQRRDGEMQGGMAAGGGDRPDPGFKSGDPLLEHRDGGVRDPRIDVADALQVEQRRGSVDIAEDIGGGLVERHRPGAGRGVGALAGMQRVFRTKQPVIIYPSSGTGAWEAAIVNTLLPGDKVLMAETGQFAVLWRGIADKFKLDVDFLFRAIGSIPGHQVAAFANLDARIAYRWKPGLEFALSGANLIDSPRREFGGGFAVTRAIRGQATIHF